MLVLIEFILSIIIKCENSQELIACFLQIPPSSMQDMQVLIEEVNKDQSEFAESEASFVARPSFRAEIVKQLEETEVKKH